LGAQTKGRPVARGRIDDLHIGGQRQPWRQLEPVPGFDPGLVVKVEQGVDHLLQHVAEIVPEGAHGKPSPGRPGISASPPMPRATAVLERDPADLPDSFVVTQSDIFVMTQSDIFVMTQSDIGEMANTSRNHVNRALQRFRATGWVTLHYNRIGIADPQALAAVIEAGGSEII
jgi:hypothetical protein